MLTNSLCVLSVLLQSLTGNFFNLFYFKYPAIYFVQFEGRIADLQFGYKRPKMVTSRILTWNAPGCGVESLGTEPGTLWNQHALRCVNFFACKASGIASQYDCHTADEQLGPLWVLSWMKPCALMLWGKRSQLLPEFPLSFCSFLALQFSCDSPSWESHTGRPYAMCTALFASIVVLIPGHSALASWRSETQHPPSSDVQVDKCRLAGDCGLAWLGKGKVQRFAIVLCSVLLNKKVGMEVQRIMWWVDRSQNNDIKQVGVVLPFQCFLHPFTRKQTRAQSWTPQHLWYECTTVAGVMKMP